MEELEQRYNHARTTPSDIFMHIDVLKVLSKYCSSVLELGTRSCVSSWGFLKGLSLSNAPVGAKLLISNDLDHHPNIDIVRNVANNIGIRYKFIQKNDLTLTNVDLGGNAQFDIVFIDTWHIYGQLKRELEKFHPIAAKYIIMHDTDIDAEHGESVRMGHDIQKMALASNYPAAEITKGLRPAIQEFLESHPEWFVLHWIRDGIGLTVLARQSTVTDVLQNVVSQNEQLL